MFRLSSSIVFAMASLLALSPSTNAATQNHPLDITTCGTDKLGVGQVTINDLPAKAGSTLTLSIPMTPLDEVSGGQVVVGGKVLGIDVPSFKVDLCTGASLKCPLKKGETQVAKISYKIPSIAPACTFKAHITGTDLEGEQLACMETSVKIINPHLRGVGGSN